MTLYFIFVETPQDSPCPQVLLENESYPIHHIRFLSCPACLDHAAILFLLSKNGEEAGKRENVVLGLTEA